MRTIVFSKSLLPEEGIELAHGRVADVADAIRASPGKDIWLMGGGDLARQFLEADLVDELYLGLVPVLIGSGIPAFPGGFSERKFELAENKSFSQGLVSLRYRRIR